MDDSACSLEQSGLLYGKKGKCHSDVLTTEQKSNSQFGWNGQILFLEAHDHVHKSIWGSLQFRHLYLFWEGDSRMKGTIESNISSACDRNFSTEIGNERIWKHVKGTLDWATYM